MSRSSADRAANLRKYGMTIVDYDTLLATQKGCCAICGEPDNQRNLCVDHDHSNGEVRGLLCVRCNVGIGNFRDNPSRLYKAILYLIGQGASGVLKDIASDNWSSRFMDFFTSPRISSNA